MDERQTALIEQPTSIPPGSKPCSPGAWKLLTGGEDGRSAVRLLAINPTLRKEVERALPVIERAKEPAEPEDILGILVRHAPAYGVHAKGPEEWAALFGSYLDALDGLSAYAVEDAFLRWNRGEGHKDLAMSGFYPKPPQLVQLAQAARQELYSACYRGRKALEYDDRPAGVQIPPEDRARMAEEMRALAASMRREVPVATRPASTPQQAAQRARDAAHADEVGDIV